MPIFCRLNVGLIGLRLGRELDESSENVVLIEIIIIVGWTKEWHKVAFVMDGPEGGGDESKEEENETGD